MFNDPLTPEAQLPTALKHGKRKMLCTQGVCLPFAFSGKNVVVAQPRSTQLHVFA
jgi:hypothetical protein